MMKILGINGSLRSGSLNGHLLRAAIDALGDSVQIEMADIASLPHYNPDLDGDTRPASAQAFIDQVKAADALVVVTPEYNHSISGVLKNAIDWASRPTFRSPLAHKPTAVLGAGMGAVGSARAQGQLHQILSSTLTAVFPHPEFLVGNAQNKFDAQGTLVDAATAEHLSRFMQAFSRWAKAQTA